MKILHFADLHLGTTSHSDAIPGSTLTSVDLNFLKCLDELVAYAHSERVDAVVFAGDAYKTRNPSPERVIAFAMRLMKLRNAGIPIVLTPGNHDIQQAMEVPSSLEMLRDIDKTVVICQRWPSVVTVATRSGPLQILSVPWIPRAFEQQGREAITKAAAQLDPALPRIALGHFHIPGAVVGTETLYALASDEWSIPIEEVAKWNVEYCALGHIHKHQIVSSVPWIVYSGSLDRVDFQEEGDDKGFVLVKLDWKGVRELALHRVPARKFVTLKLTDVRAGIETEELEGAVVRIRGTRKSTEGLPEAELNRIRSVTSKLYVEVDVEESARMRLPTQTLGVGQLLSEWAKQRGVDDAKAGKLLSVANQLASEQGVNLEEVGSVGVL